MREMRGWERLESFRFKKFLSVNSTCLLFTSKILMLIFCTYYFPCSASAFVSSFYNFPFSSLLHFLSPPTHTHTPQPIFKTLEDCLSYFTTHGLVELPSQRDEEEEEYHLPRVNPLDNIVSHVDLLLVQLWSAWILPWCAFVSPVVCFWFLWSYFCSLVVCVWVWVVWFWF